MALTDDSPGGGDRPQGSDDGSPLFPLRTFVVITCAAAMGVLAGLVAGLTVGLKITAGLEAETRVILGVIAGLAATLFAGLTAANLLHALIAKRPTG